MNIPCPNCPTVADADGNVYSTVQIGNFCWMAENLKVGTTINSSYSQSNNSEIEKYCYGNDVENCKIYGGLYQWEEMMQYAPSDTGSTQGICPDGWHIPTNNELSNLVEYIGDDFNVGGKLKEGGTDHWLFPNTGATNESGFSALPGGIRTFTGTFEYLNKRGFFYSSNRPSNEYADYFFFLYDQDYYIEASYKGSIGRSCRCVKNYP